jgi:GlpG protein
VIPTAALWAKARAKRSPEKRRSIQGDCSLRQIGTLPKGLDLKVFTDYLLTLGMKSRADDQPEGWNLWIYNEDHFARAREELQTYVNNPEDPRYREAAQAAQSIRRQEQQLDEQFRKNYREVSDQWAQPGFRRRPLTVTLVAICMIVFILQNSSLRTKHKMQKWMWITTFRVGADGESRDNGLDDIRHGEVWRLVTPVVMHANILHILFNMWCLSALGTVIEGRRGTLRLAALILVSAVVSNLGEYFYDLTASGQAHPSEGMSGVVFALFGYIWMKGLYEPEQGMVMHPNNITIMMFWLFFCMTGFAGPIANAAHVTGLLVGVTLGLLRF